MTFVQLQSCIEIDGNVTRCETPEASFFGVYVGEAGSYEWIADFASRDDAWLYANELCEQHGYDLDDLT